MGPRTATRSLATTGGVALAVLLGACQTVVPATTSPVTPPPTTAATGVASATTPPRPTLRPTVPPPSLAPFGPRDPKAPWFAFPRLWQARQDHTATVLADGRILVVGGQQRSLDPQGETRVETIASVELFWPRGGPHWELGAPLHQARSSHHAVLLRDGRVLVYGGHRANGQYAEAIDTAELYDPATEEWQVVAGSPGLSIDDAILLPDGRVVTTGLFGSYPDTRLRLVFFDPETSAWSRGALAPETRIHPALALLQDGTLLVAGGSNDVPDGPASPTAEAWRYDPGTDTWRAAATLPGDGITGGSTFNFEDGRVVVVSSGPTLGYDQAADRWTALASSPAGRDNGLVARLRDGRILGVGSSSCHQDSELAEIYDPGADTWTPAGELHVAARGALVVQASGRAVVIGGSWACSGPNANDGPYADAFVLDPNSVG